jgi:hypothetical protein
VKLPTLDELLNSTLLHDGRIEAVSLSMTGKGAYEAVIHLSIYPEPGSPRREAISIVTEGLQQISVDCSIPLLSQHRPAGNLSFGLEPPDAPSPSAFELHLAGGFVRIAARTIHIEGERQQPPENGS